MATLAATPVHQRGRVFVVMMMDLVVGFLI